MKTTYIIRITIITFLIIVHGWATGEVLYQVDSIRMVGHTSTVSPIIMRYAPFRHGKSYSQSQLDKGIEQFSNSLKRTLFFEQVRVWYRLQQNQAIIFVFVTDAQFPYVISGGPVYGTFSQLNVLGDGNVSTFTLGKNAFGAQKLWNYGQPKVWQISITGNWFQNSDFLFNSSFMDSVTGSMDQYRFEVELERIIHANWNARVSSGVERFNYYGIPEKYKLNLRGNNKNWLFLSFVVQRDTRNHIFFPDRGSYGALRWHFSIRPETMQQNYWGISVDYRRYIPLNKSAGLFMRYTGSMVNSVIPYQGLIQMDRFDGIRIPSGKTLHGKISLASSAEWRQKIMNVRSLLNSQLLVGMFGDAGWVENNRRLLALNRIVYAWGPFVRIQIPYPIYVTLNFEYGINSNGHKFFFGVHHNL